MVNRSGTSSEMPGMGERCGCHLVGGGLCHVGKKEAKPFPAPHGFIQRASLKSSPAQGNQGHGSWRTLWLNARSLVL